MKTLKLIICMICISACAVVAQSSTEKTPASPPSGQVQKANAATQQMQGQQQPVQPGASGVQQASGVRASRFMVQLPHKADQCQAVKDQLKAKNEGLLMRFDWACAAGEHVGYAMLGGQTADDVRKQLPEGILKSVKITKVDKATPSSTPAEPVKMAK